MIAIIDRRVRLLNRKSSTNGEKRKFLVVNGMSESRTKCNMQLIWPLGFRSTHGAVAANGINMFLQARLCSSL